MNNSPIRGGSPAGSSASTNQTTAGTAAASSSTLSSGSSGTITVVPPVNGPRVMAQALVQQPVTRAGALPYPVAGGRTGPMPGGDHATASHILAAMSTPARGQADSGMVFLQQMEANVEHNSGYRYNILMGRGLVAKS